MTNRAAKRDTVAEYNPVVYVIDDDQSVRDALDSLFRSVGHKVCAFGSAQEFLNEKSDGMAGCMVLDVRLPGLSGLDFQSQLANLGVSLPVILMTGHGDIPMSVRGMKAGAIDFLAKPFRDQDMLDAVAAAIETDRTSRRERGAVADIAARYESLSPREKEVMGLVVKGLMNKQIAFELDLSEITIKIHRGSAMRKMQARSLAELVKMAEKLKSALDQGQAL